MRLDSWKSVVVLCVGMGCIAGMQMYAMANGHDGVVLTMAVTAVAGTMGVGTGYFGRGQSKKADGGGGGGPEPGAGN